MAVQQNKKSPSRRGHRRAHAALSSPTLATDSATGELHRRHHLTKDGYYRGRKILAAVVNPLPLKPEKKVRKKAAKAKPAAPEAAGETQTQTQTPEAQSETQAQSATEENAQEESKQTKTETAAGS